MIRAVLEVKNNQVLRKIYENSTNLYLKLQLNNYNLFLGEQTYKRINQRRREPRRHTLQSGVDYNMVGIFYILLK